MSEELQFTDWLPKLSERLFFILRNIKEKHDLNEEDWDLLEYFHGVYWRGELPFFRHRLNLSDETALEQELFGQIDSTAGRGTEIDYNTIDKI